MKQIFEGTVFDILPTQNGILFSYHKDTLEDKIVIGYKMLSFDTGRFSDVAKNVYLVTKYGHNYKSVINYCNNYILTRAIVLPNSKVFILKIDGEAMLLDADASPVWQGSLTYRGCVANDITVYKNTLWAAYGECNVLLRYNLFNMREELRIGGNHSPFDKPKSLYLKGDTAIISNQGSQKLISVNLDSYAVSELQEFDEPVSQYIESGKYSFVLLKSGIYAI